MSKKITKLMVSLLFAIVLVCAVFPGHIMAASEHSVNFTYDASLGSITVNGANPAARGAVTVPAEGAVLNATANSDSNFIGWINADTHEILSTEADYTLMPASDMNVRAVFAQEGGAPVFMVGNKKAEKHTTRFVYIFTVNTVNYHTISGTKLYEDFNAAAAEAARIKGAAVLTNNATLPAGNYTIPQNASVLIPFDAANTMFTDTVLNSSTYTASTPYRTLTMENGATITVNGTLSISAKQKATTASDGCGGAPIGPTGILKMETESNITVNNGGILSAFGFVTGSGTVTVKNGGKVYEMFQISDFRGGTQSTANDMKTHKVFPLSQYYVQNIEVPMTMYQGAEEYCAVAIFASDVDIGSTVKFVSSNGAMFNLKGSGSITKYYDGTTDRLMIETDGNVTFSSISISVSINSINSTDFVLPINSNVTITIRNGGNVTTNQNVSLLPGSKIIIDEGGTLTIGRSKSVYVYDADQWGNYTGSADQKFFPVKYAPGKAYTRTVANLVDAEILVNGTIDATLGSIYTTEGGANIWSEGSGVVKIPGYTNSTTYQLIQLEPRYVPISVVSAKLKNADGNYVETKNGYKDENGFVYVSGHWCGHKKEEVDAVAATCTKTGLTEGIECTECKYNTQTVVPALGHTKTTITGKAATCTETGLTDGIKCSVCDEVLTKQEVIEKKPHTERIIPAVPATCTVAGLTEGKDCSVCETILVEQKLTDLAPHTESTIPAVDPTCTETGLTAGIKCSVCQEVLKKQEVIPFPGHTESPIPGYAATCTKKGLTDGVKCSVCKEVLTAQDEISPLGHTETTIPGYAATCTETGLTDGVKCSVCTVVLTEQKIIEKKPHTETIVPDVLPTCTEPGFDKTICKICECDLDIPVDVPALGHTEDVNEGKEPTYTEKGWHPYKSCSRCDWTEEIDYIPVLGESDTDGMDYVFSYNELTSTSVSVSLKNTTGEDLTATVVLAAYDESGKLISIRYATATINADGSADFTVFFPEGSDVNYVKAFILGDGYAPVQDAWKKVFKAPEDSE